MFAKTKKIEREYIGKDIKDFWEIPDLRQTSSKAAQMNQRLFPIVVLTVQNL